MLIFLQEYCWALTVLLGLAYAGGFVTLQFQNSFRYPYLLAPFAGLTFVVMGVSIFYSLTLISVQQALMAVIFLCYSATTLSLMATKNLRLVKFDLRIFVFILLLVALLTYICDFTKLQLGAAGFLFKDGTDLFGYGQVADWLNMHNALNQPVNSVDFPYQAWPSWVFKHEHRFGSYFTLAIFSILKGTVTSSAIYAYDSACTVVLSLMLLGVATVFSKSRFSFICICLFMLTTYWYDYTRQGFFAKILAYPGAMIVMGLFLFSPRPFKMPQVLTLVALTFAVSAMHSYLSVGVIFCALGGSYVLVNMIKDVWQIKSLSSECRDDFLLFTMLIGCLIANIGILSRVQKIDHSCHWAIGWRGMMPRILDIEGLFRIEPTFTSMSLHSLNFLAVLNLLIIFYFLYSSIRIKKIIPTAIIMGLLSVMGALVLKSDTWGLYQLTGVFYPLFLCAAVIAIESVFAQTRRKDKFMLPLLLGIVVLIHIPRVIGDIKSFANPSVTPANEYNKKDFDRMVELSGEYGVIVDSNDVFYTIPLLVDVGKRSAPLQFSERAWKVTFAYLPWQVPKLHYSPYWVETNDTLIKPGCSVIYKGLHTSLLDCSKSSATNALFASSDHERAKKV